MFAGYDPFEALYASAAATIVDFSVEQALVLALLVRLPTANTTMPARMPRITMTMSNSTRVNPRSITFLWSVLDRSFFSTRIVLSQSEAMLGPGPCYARRSHVPVRTA